MLWSKYIIQKNPTRLAIIRNKVQFIILHLFPVWRSQSLVLFPCPWYIPTWRSLPTARPYKRRTDRWQYSVSSSLCCNMVLVLCCLQICSGAKCGTSGLGGGGSDSLGGDCWAVVSSSSGDVGCIDGVDSLTGPGDDCIRCIFLDEVGVCLLTRLQVPMPGEADSNFRRYLLFCRVTRPAPSTLSV